MFTRFLMYCWVRWAFRTLHTGCAIPPKTLPLRGGLTRQQFGQMASLQPEWDLRDHTHVIHFNLHSLISSHPFHPDGAQNRCGATYLPTWSHSSTLYGSPSLVPAPQLLSLSHKNECPFRHGGSYCSRGLPRGTTLTFVIVYIPPAPSCPRLWRPSGGPCMPVCVWRIQRPPSLLVLQNRRW